MFIQVQETPNPNSLKFVPGVQIMESGTVNFENAQSAVGSPLARYDQVLNRAADFCLLKPKVLSEHIVFASLTH
jgi:hypothetical protein